MKSNVEIVKEIMTTSKHGALAQAFVIDALSKFSSHVLESESKDYEGSLVNESAWKSVAKEINEKLNGYYKEGRN